MLMASSRRRSPPSPRTLIAIAVAAVVVAALLMVSGDRPPEELRAQQFVSAWEQGNYRAMHAALTPQRRRSKPLGEFIAAYRKAAATATATSVRAGKVGKERDSVVSIPMTVLTRAFGPVRGTLRLPFSGGDDPRIEWSANLVFPGLARGERLQRDIQLPRRADILARDGTPLAQGQDRSSPLGAIASAIVGELGPAPPERAERLRELGFPDDATVGLSGLERIFDERVAGKPGGELRAGARTLARSTSLPANAVRTSIDPAVQQAAVQAKGAYVGGIAVVRPRTGEILGLSGIAFSGLQPPGSTFKMVTLTGVLQAKIAGPRSTFPVETKTTIEGVDLENANGESCGGTLRHSFAHSCNSVFAPLGAKLGGKGLVKTAEAFGFNKDLGIPGAATSTIPSADEIGDDLAVGSSAIGQGLVQATALQMAWVAATIGSRGKRSKLTLQRVERTNLPRRPQAIDRDVAMLVGRYMEAVVEEGTGKAAAISGVRVAGKTGTAELRTTTRTPACLPAPEGPECPPVLPDDPTDTDAWFAAFAPAARARVAVGVLLVGAGVGGDTAAPVAKQVLVAALKATR
ncbi:MAG: penicillin-binding protein [Solirubrobacteraceae bacterium]|nr:penicillin-binding protein [Solirubrobacteraceae bacterium]